jgi:transposase
MNPHTMNSDEDRLEIFRALRSQIRGSTEVLLVGIDVAKQRHHAFFGTPAGETLRKRFVFGNHRAGFEALVGLAGDLQRQHELPQRVFGLEPTGVYHKPLLEFLIGEGEQAVLVSNVAVARNRELLDGRWDKNDVNDPANVADLVGQARCLFADHPTAELRELRSFVRARARLKKQEHAVRLRIRNHLIAQYFPELEAAYAKGGGANDAAEPGWNPRHEARVRQVWQAAAQSIGCPLDAAVRWEAPRLVHRLQALRDDLRELEQRMHPLAQRLPGYPSVKSIPGMGPVLTALVLAGIGDPHRFAHPRQVLRLAGLDLCARRSGTSSDRAVPRISKQGKASLRYALVHAAMVAARSDPALRGYFSRLVAGRTHERGIRRKMYVKLAAKLLVIAWTLMRRGDTFRPDRFGE